MSEDRLDDIEPSIMNWVIRKYESGMSREQLKEELEDDVDDTSIVDTILDSGKARRQGNESRFDDDFISLYRSSVHAVFSVDETWLRNVGELSYRQSTGILLVNGTILGLLGLVLIGGTGMLMSGFLFSADILGLLIGISIGIVINVTVYAALTHVVVRLMGGGGLKTTYNICAVLSVIFTVFWIPLLNLFMWLYGLMVFIRALEEAHELTFFRAGGVAVGGFLLWAIVLGSFASTTGPTIGNEVQTEQLFQT